MKKLLLFLMLLIVGMSAQAQYSPSNNLNYVKLLKTPPIGTKADSVMVYDGTDKFVKMIPKSEVTEGKEDIANKISVINGYSETLYPNEKATHDGLDLKLNISDLPTNLTLYPTTVVSDVSGYVNMVTDIHDVDYNTVAVDVSTPLITTTNQLISSRISAPGVLIGQPGVFNITTFGNIRHLSGSGTASFYFEVYKRTAAGVETLICTSSNSLPVTNGGYSEFSASGVWDDGDFLATDRIVIKSYANRIVGGSDPIYQFQFGGASPVRTILPVPFSVVDAGYEVKINKVSTLTASDILYPNNNAVITGLALKANINNPTFTGVLTNTNNIRSNNTNGVPSRFGTTSSMIDGADFTDVVVSTNSNFSGGSAHYRGLFGIAEFTGASSSTGTLTGVSGIGISNNTATGNLTLSSIGGGIKGGRFSASNAGSGSVEKISGVSGFASNNGGVANVMASFNSEVPFINTGKLVNSHSAFLVEGGSVSGTLTNNHGLYINPLIAGANRWGIYQAGSTDKNYFAGNTLFGTTTDNSQGVAQFNGNITISDGTLSNHAVSKGQLDLKENAANKVSTLTASSVLYPNNDAVITGLAIKFGGTVATNTIPKATGVNTFGTSTISDNGTVVTFTNGILFNGTHGLSGSNAGTTIKLGQQAGLNNTGGDNLYIGFQNGINMLGGTRNLLQGSGNASSMTSGNDNIIQGYRAATESFSLAAVTSLSNSILIGSKIKPLNPSGDTNEIVIGVNGEGLGSNTSVFGNSLTSFGRFWGKLLVGKSTNDGINDIQANGTISSGTTTLGASQPTANNQLTRKDYTDTALALKANKNNADLTGVPTAPTAITGSTGAQIASLDFVENAKQDLQSVLNKGGVAYLDNNVNFIKGVVVRNEISDIEAIHEVITSKVDSPNSISKTGSIKTSNGSVVISERDNTNLSSLVFTTPIASTTLQLPAKSVGTYTLATTSDVALKANISSPALTGIPTAPTAAVGTNTTQVATTSFVANTIVSQSDWSKSSNDIYNSNTGNVGIGTSTPSQKFEVRGNALINSGVLNDSRLYFGETLLYIKGSSGNGSISFFSNGANISSFGNGSASVNGTFSSAGALSSNSGRINLYTGNHYWNLKQGTGNKLQITNETNGDVSSFEISVNNVATLPNVTNTLISAETTGKVIVTREYINRVFTVATLPTPASGIAYATVTDATAPTYLGALVGGGSVVTPVFYNGTIWVSH